MPPVAKAGGDQFRKSVRFDAVTKDSDEYELEATGIVMVPDKADLQNDFAREDTIRAFADQFGTFAEAGQAGGGIMHAVWPDDWMALERNEVLNESEEIGGRAVEAGAWVQRWGVSNAELAALIDDGILDGYSIGAIQVDWSGPFEQDEADDVDTSELPDGEMVWELTDGIIREVSAVDIPAVPDAQILEAKADSEKRLADHLGNADAFLEEAMERGHTEAEAERLWDVLNEAMETDGASDPGKQTVLGRAGKAFLSVLSGGDTDTDTDAGTTASKAGRTLSKSNRESAMAAIDANLDMLEDSGMDHGMTRFTDQDDVDFNLTEHEAREWTGPPDDEDGEDEEEDSGGMEARGKDAPDGDTSDDDDTTDMSDDSDPWDDAPEWAKDLRDSTEENSKRIDDLADDGDADGDADADPWDDAPEWAKALAAEQEKNADRIDTIARQSGFSDQLEAAADGDGGDGDDDNGLGAIGKALS